MVELTAVRTALDVGLKRGFHIHQMDVNIAFLHGNGDVQIHIVPPLGVSLCRLEKVLRLKRSFMGASRLLAIERETNGNDVRHMPLCASN